MCTAAFVNKKKCWSCGELAVAMGTPIVVSVYEGLPPLELEEQDCLCNVDIEAMAAASGATWERDDIGDYVVTTAGI
jgi:hypothetical protein